jgi:hypothetical protein
MSKISFFHANALGIAVWELIGGRSSMSTCPPATENPVRLLGLQGSRGKWLGLTGSTCTEVESVQRDMGKVTCKRSSRVFVLSSRRFHMLPALSEGVFDIIAAEHSRISQPGCIMCR